MGCDAPELYRRSVAVRQPPSAHLAEDPAQALCRHAGDTRASDQRLCEPALADVVWSAGPGLLDCQRPRTREGGEFGPDLGISGGSRTHEPGVAGLGGA